MNLALWTAIGVGVGALIGIVIDNPGLGIAVGIALGAAVGYLLNRRKGRG